MPRKAESATLGVNTKRTKTASWLFWSFSSGSMYFFSDYFIFKLTRMRVIPQKRKIIFVNEIFSASPTKPIAVVTINTNGPTNARSVLIRKAFSKSLNLNINAAAVTSILPEISRKIMMVSSAFSITTTTPLDRFIPNIYALRTGNISALETHS